MYEVGSIGLSQIITHMNAGEDFSGREIDAPTSFFLGVAVSPAADGLPYEVERFEQKLEAGARFAMTRVLSTWRTSTPSWPSWAARARFRSSSGSSTSKPYQLALRLHNEVPGIVVPDPVQARLRDAGPNAAAEGLAIARELLDEARERAAGVYLIALPATAGRARLFG